MRSLAGFVGMGLLCLGCSGKTTTGPGSGGDSSIGPVGSGGSTSSSGANSSGGSSGVPTSGGLFVDRLTQNGVDKIDLLFMIDNSVSMTDKQEILKAAVPGLLGRLVAPICVDGAGNPAGGSTLADGTCAAPGSKPEFAPIGDIHIGIVSSSLGAHGGAVCASLPMDADPEIVHLDDRAHLIGSVRTGVASWNNSGFLAWDPAGAANTPPGESNASSLAAGLSAMVEATGQHGCGYEASLESWYRFLIDPEPPAAVSKVGNLTVRQGVDADLLAQRAAFLRPDSLVAIVMLSDENDCSIRDDGLGWLAGSVALLPKATASCSINPNDPCCRSCAEAESAPPNGCSALAADPNCMGAAAGTYKTWGALHDSLNLRCFQQKQRFGFDLLYETQRYVTGLTSPSLTLQSDPSKSVVNPLFDPGTSGKAPRDPSLVFLAGIVGVPWQDIATADSLASPTTLRFLTAAELVAQGRWQQLLGDDSASPPVPPSDPFMVESIAPRSGTNPNAPFAISPATSMNPRQNPINGHEQWIPAQDDLEFACTFELATPKVCAPGDLACDCAPATNGDVSALTAANSPLCQPPGGGAGGTTQFFAKAYPGARELKVLRDFGDNAIVGSICPKVTTSANPSQDPSYGYNPAIVGLIDRLKDVLRPRCLPRALAHAVDSSGNASAAIECGIVEARAGASCGCDSPGRSQVAAATAKAVFTQLQASGACGAAGQAACDTTGFCLCEIEQEAGPQLTACVANAATSTAGFCYIDDPASPALAECPSNEKRRLRFVDQGDTKTPAVGALTFIACSAGP